MSDFDDSQAPSVKPDPPKPLGYFAGLHFYPKIKLDKKAGLEFGSKLTEYADTENVDLQSNQWTFVLKGDLEAVVSPYKFEFQGYEPSHRMEWYEAKFRTILKLFSEHFRPAVVTSKAMARVLFAVDGDARELISDQIMALDEARLTALKRPLHLIGVRFDLPAFDPEEGDEEREQGQDTTCDITVRFESYSVDPRWLYVEVDASWTTPEQWNEDEFEKVVGRLDFVQRFVTNEVTAFLTSK